VNEITVTINGSQVSAGEGMTILEVAQENGIDIPTLCYRPELPPIGSCRICVVEVEGSKTLVGSCYTPITQGMVIHTHSPQVLEARKTIIELLLAVTVVPALSVVTKPIYANCVALRLTWK